MLFLLSDHTGRFEFLLQSEDESKEAKESVQIQDIEKSLEFFSSVSYEQRIETEREEDIEENELLNKSTKKPNQLSLQCQNDTVDDMPFDLVQTAAEGAELWVFVRTSGCREAKSRLAGWMSRCMMPAPCRKARPAHSSAHTFAHSASGSAPRCLIATKSSPPDSSSRASVTW